ncbi:MAG: efflux RND transporter periplasmic adaptor subunit [Bacteroidetes bacterium]|nr:efflux RND transporter periplasmic adaptor subunit [Bacteroidota bacterium]
MKLNIKIQFISLAIILFSFLGCGEKNETHNESKEENQSKHEEHAEEGHDKHSKEVKLTKESIALAKITTEEIKLSELKGFISLPATIVSNKDNEALVGSLVQGRVQKIFVNMGDFVKKGQILMTVEGLDIGSINAGFIKAKATLDYAKSVYERQKKLIEDNIGSQKVLAESKAEFEKSLAEYNAEDKKIHSIGLSDDDVINGKTADEHTSGTLLIKSPINGFIIERNVVIGQSVDATTNAFKISNTSTVWIDGQLFEKDLNKINQKTMAYFKTSIYSNELFNGKVIFIGQSIDEKSRTLLVRGEFANSNSKLKPQMYGELNLPIGENTKAILIPEESVIKEGEQYFVFVQENDTIFEQRLVTVGLTLNNKVEIKDGLKVGERFVLDGVFYLKSEMKKEELEGDEH